MSDTIKFITYNHTYYDKWEKIVEESNNGTIYHSQKFLSYHAEGKFNNFHHLISVDGQIKGIIPGAISVDSAGTKIFSSYPGTSVGGFVLPSSFGLQTINSIISSFLSYLKKDGFNRVFITPTPFFYGKNENQHIDFVLSRESFSFRKRELTSVIKLPSVLDDTLSFLKPEVRRAVRKAEKDGVTVVEDNSREAYINFYKILENNLKSRHSVKPVHSLDEMVDLNKRFPERITLMAAYINDEMAGGIWLFRANPKVAIAFYIAQDYKLQNARISNLLYLSTIKRVKEWGHDYYELGLFTVDMNPNFGLCRFKESYGGVGLFREYFQKEL